jgi:hypothetical protein
MVEADSAFPRRGWLSRLAHLGDVACGLSGLARRRPRDETSESALQRLAVLLAEPGADQELVNRLLSL